MTDFADKMKMIEELKLPITLKATIVEIGNALGENANLELDLNNQVSVARYVLEGHPSIAESFATKCPTVTTAIVEGFMKDTDGSKKTGTVN